MNYRKLALNTPNKAFLLFRLILSINKYVFKIWFYLFPIKNESESQENSQNTGILRMSLG